MSKIAFRYILVALLSAAALSTAPVLSESLEEPIARMEALAFGHAQPGSNDENRVLMLEQKAYGKPRIGALPLRIAALQYFFGIAPEPLSTAATATSTGTGKSTATPTLPENSISKSGFASRNEKASSKSPLQAGITETRMHMQAGDDERFGGLWVGTLGSKIDPQVHVFCELHGSGKSFTGTMIWTSKICGGCRRTIIGYYAPKDQACMMKDLSVEPINASNKAGFCRVDKYAFGVTENAERLSGWFKANQCRDAGPVTLVRYKSQ